MVKSWPIVPINELFRLKQGTYLKPVEMAEEKTDAFPFPVYGANGVIGYSSRKMYSDRTTLISCRGANCGVVHYTVSDAWVSNNSIACIPIAEADPDFYYYVCLNTDFGDVVTGSAQPQITITNLSGKHFIRPPLPTQRRIAGILSTYDELIENNQRRIKILESMARALYREWFVNFNFPGHESVPSAPSPLGEIPEGWEVKTVQEIVRRIPVGKKYDQKTVSATGEVPVFDQGKKGVIGYHDEEPGVTASESKPVIVFANHTCYQRLIHVPFSAIQNVLPFASSHSVPRNIYWLHWATNGLIALNDYKGHWPEFEAKMVVVPPAVLCDQFGSFAEPLSRQMLKLNNQIQHLRRTRDLLLPRLLAGQIDVEAMTP